MASASPHRTCLVSFSAHASLQILVIRPLNIPPPAPFFAFSCCILLMYCLLTVFQTAIYLSMHCVTHAPSPLDNEAPGLGTHFSKQCSFTFSINCRALVMAASLGSWPKPRPLLMLSILAGCGILVLGRDELD